MSYEEFTTAQRRVLERYAVDAESTMVDVPMLEGSAHVLVAGEGPPVMMVIGGGIVAGTWAPLMRELEGYTLYAVDLPGQGLSDPITHRPATIRDNATTFLRQILDRLGLDRPPFVAQSMGGQWATWLAVANPERVATISYVACPAFILNTSAPFPMRLASVPAVNRLVSRLDPPSPAQVRRLMRMVGEEPTGLAEIGDLLLAYERMPGQAEAFGALLQASMTRLAPRPEVRLTPALLRRVSQPVQFIWGEDDPFGAPGVGERAAEIMPDAEFHLVRGGHAPWLRNSEEVAAHLLPFLAKHSDNQPMRQAETR